MVAKDDSMTDEWTQSDFLILAGHSLQAGGQHKNKQIMTRPMWSIILSISVTITQILKIFTHSYKWNNNDTMYCISQLTYRTLLLVLLGDADEDLPRVEWISEIQQTLLYKQYQSITQKFGKTSILDWFCALS